MPELPEVETIKRGLSDKLVGKEIVDLSFDWPKSFQGKKEDVIGQEIVGVERRAKVIRLKLSNGLNMLFHLKLTGQLIHENSVRNEEVIDFAGGHPSHDWHAKLPNSNTRIIFTFDDGSKLFFNDMRKFGWCKVLTDDQIAAIYKKDYGLEPLSASGQDNPNFNVNYLLSKAKNIPNRNIKQFVMDQTIAAGMGNIYTDEALFDAKLLPTRKVKDVSMSEWRDLIISMQKVLKLGIKYGGTTDSDYVNVDGKKGGMQDYLKVYHRTGLPCSGNCGGVVKRISIGGRGTHYCEKCQN